MAKGGKEHEETSALYTEDDVTMNGKLISFV